MVAKMSSIVSFHKTKRKRRSFAGDNTVDLYAYKPGPFSELLIACDCCTTLTKDGK